MQFIVAVLFLVFMFCAGTLFTGRSSDNLEFVDVLVDEGTLYPVFKINEYGPNDPVTDDIILYAFYAEVPIDGNYNIGEMIIQTR